MYFLQVLLKHGHIIGTATICTCNTIAMLMEVASHVHNIHYYKYTFMKNNIFLTGI